MSKARKKEKKRATLGHFDYDQFYEQLSSRIRTLRKEKGFSSAENFAYDIEISRISMGKFESGNFTGIQMSTLLKIIDGLEITPAEFFAKGFD